MIKDVGLSLQNTVLYKDVGFKFTPGLHVVYGLNKTTKNSMNGNAAGKTFLFSQLPEILSNAPVVGARTERVSQGTRRLYFTMDGERYVLERNNSKVKIVKDGQAIATTAKAVTDFIANDLTYTEDEILSCIYIGDKSSNHPLISKSEAERKRFFSSFFQQDRLDEEKKVIQAAYRKLAYVPELLKEKEQQLAANSTELDIKEASAKLKALKKKLAALEKKQIDFDKARQQEQFRNNNKRSLQILQKLKVPTNDKAALKDNLAKLQRRLEELETLYRKARDYEEQKELYEEYLEELSDVPSAAKALLENERSNVVKYAQRYDKLVYELRAKNREKKTLTKPEATPKDPGYDLDELRADLQVTQSILRHIDEGNCPTCGSKFTSSRDYMEKKRKVLRKKIERQEVYEELLKENKEYLKEKKKQDALEKELTKLKKRAEKYKQYKVASGYLDITPVPKPEPVKESVKVLRTRMRRCQEGIAAINLVGRNFSLLNSASEGKDYSEKIIQLRSEYSKLYAELEVAKRQTKLKRKLVKEVDALRVKAERRENIATLLKAYDNKAVKQMLIDQVSALFVTTLNKYASQVFPEDFKFNFSWEDRASLTVTRRHKGKITTTSIDKLSGAETSLFLGVLTLTLRKFKAKRRRFPVLIWDEPAASMSEESFGTLEKLIDIMRKEIDCVVILTPKYEERYAESNAYTVVKQQGQSKLITGYPKRGTNDSQSLGSDQFEP